MQVSNKGMDFHLGKKNINCFYHFCFCHTWYWFRKSSMGRIETLFCVSFDFYFRTIEFFPCSFPTNSKLFFFLKRLVFAASKFSVESCCLREKFKCLLPKPEEPSGYSSNKEWQTIFKLIGVSITCESSRYHKPDCQ